MNRVKVATDYSIDFLEVDRPQPLSDKLIEETIQDILNGKLDRCITNNVYIELKEEMQEYILSSQINKRTPENNNMYC